MALLTDTKSRRKKSVAQSTDSPSSSVPQSLPDLESSKRIESLERELAEVKASGEASKQEVENLKRQLAEAKTAPPKSEPQTQTVSKTDEREERKSFFGV